MIERGCTVYLILRLLSNKVCPHNVHAPFHNRLLPQIRVTGTLPRFQGPHAARPK
jgi:hypothetical protein